jgi:hypothetical protein
MQHRLSRLPQHVQGHDEGQRLGDISCILLKKKNHGFPSLFSGVYYEKQAKFNDLVFANLKGGAT